MTIEILAISLLVLALVVFFVVLNVRRHNKTIHNPQPVLITFKDPFALATGFNYTLNPNEPRKKSFGYMEFITATGGETPPEHRSFDTDEGKQGDTLSVTWKLRDGTDVVGMVVIPASSASSLMVTLMKERAVEFE